MLRDSEERFSPHQTGDIALDHYARYTVAAMILRPEDEVLDVASGEGYGSAMLAGRARRVTGVDLNSDAVQHAGKRYAAPNLRYVQDNAETLCTMPEALFDVVVSFETIEHVHNPMQMLDSIKRVLKPNGYVMISTPDEEVFNAGRTTKNPYHPSEFTAFDFEAALTERWEHVRMLGQHTKRYSLITTADGNPTSSFSLGRARNERDIVISPIIPRPMYLIGFASDGAMPQLPSLVFG